MGTLDTDLIALIDQRVRAAQAMTRAAGTCVTRATTGPGATVVFDGSTVAVPVKVLGSVSLAEGARCVLDKYGSEWVVTGSFSAFRLGYAAYHNVGSTGESTVSGSYVDMAQISPLAFTKYYDQTYVRLAIKITNTTQTAANTGLRTGLRFAPTSGQDYTATDYNVTLLFINTTAIHQTSAGWVRIPDIPAGDYQVQLRWRRSTGSGTCWFDTNDEISIEVDEIVHYAHSLL